jgi:alkylhydroperoxidase family enzyme
METQRIKALNPPYDEEIQKDFDTIMPPGIPPLNIFRTIANNPRVLHRMVIGGLLDKGSIAVQDRELVILRACALCKAEYEWGVHVAAFSGHAKINQEQVYDTVKKKINPELWSETQVYLLELVDQLHETQTVTDDLWINLCKLYRHDQLIELIMVTGLYHAVSFIVNSLHIEKEEFAPAFSKL